MLRDKVLDPDEKVRAAVCKVYSQLDYESALHHVSQTQLQAVAGRGLDKKASVRHEALNAVGKLYSLAYPEMYVPFLCISRGVSHRRLARPTTRLRSHTLPGYPKKYSKLRARLQKSDTSSSKSSRTTSSRYPPAAPPVQRDRRSTRRHGRIGCFALCATLARSRLKRCWR